MSLDACESYRLPSPDAPSESRPPRLKTAARLPRLNDAAAQVMTEFASGGARTVSEDCGLEAAQDEMFRWGARALLVLRGDCVVGVVTADGIAAERRAYVDGLDADPGARVDDLMTQVDEVPAIEWQTVLDATVRDVAEMFQGTGAQILIVVETETATEARVRGIFERSRLERQFGPLARR